MPPNFLGILFQSQPMCLTCYNYGRSCCNSLKKISFTSGTFPVMRRRNYIIYREYMLTYVCCSNSVEGRMNEYRNNGLTVIKNVLGVLPKTFQIFLHLLHLTHLHLVLHAPSHILHLLGTFLLLFRSFLVLLILQIFMLR